jgi:DNA-binding SARP family transcriptional activator
VSFADRDWQNVVETLKPIRIQLCGPMVVSIGGARIEERLPSRQGRLLFAYLICERGHRVRRDVLMDALWPQGRPASAAAALNSRVSKLRTVLAPLEIEGRSELALPLPDDAIVDLELAREAIHRAQSAVASERWTDAWAPSRVALHTADREFLPGLEAPWIDEQRRDLEQLKAAALECVAAVGLGIGGAEIAATERAARRLISLAPFHESGYRLLMETLEREDNPAEGLLVYEQLRTLLKDELGIAPGAATQELHQRLLDRRTA